LHWQLHNTVAAHIGLYHFFWSCSACGNGSDSFDGTLQVLLLLPWDIVARNRCVAWTAVTAVSFTMWFVGDQEDAWWFAAGCVSRLAASAVQLSWHEFERALLA
jgi:hypothetical protein